MWAGQRAGLGATYGAQAMAGEAHDTGRFKAARRTRPAASVCANGPGQRCDRDLQRHAIDEHPEWMRHDPDAVASPDPEGAELFPVELGLQRLARPDGFQLEASLRARDADGPNDRGHAVTRCACGNDAARVPERPVEVWEKLGGFWIKPSPDAAATGAT